MLNEYLYIKCRIGHKAEDDIDSKSSDDYIQSIDNNIEKTYAWGHWGFNSMNEEEAVHIAEEGISRK